ncbi:DUF2059 domain-containing protein [Geotalea uraniireducens]|uniref:DUF2059 domain-containing protein n=1 Tax=Geotalea uraniireducens (strain Rf4) TaxID=351605 RepID=A5G9X5_GEOUR|nr:DUF2059 domain-containing protein [Geotalea uraniireducens]ABQ25627.1 hypothetical protein Gura_1426 [Geotalea uraniireducens Rf4]
MKAAISGLLFLSVYLPSFCFASDLSQRAAAEKLMMETRIDKMLEKYTLETEEKLKKQLLAVAPKDTDRQIAEKYFDNINKIINRELGWQKIKDEVVAVYADLYTKDELNEMSKFFSSPAGQKFIAKASELNERLISVLRVKMQGCLPEVKKLAGDMEKEMANKNIR